MLGRAVIERDSERGQSEVRGGYSSEHYARRSIERAILALFFARQIETPTKTDDMPVILLKLARIEPATAASIGGALAEGPLDAERARDVLLIAAQRLAAEPQIAESMRRLVALLWQPIGRLGATPPLKS